MIPHAATCCSGDSTACSGLSVTSQLTPEKSTGATNQDGAHHNKRGSAAHAAPSLRSARENRGRAIEQIPPRVDTDALHLNW